jgi:predicted outer membrane protein
MTARSILILCLAGAVIAEAKWVRVENGRVAESFSEKPNFHPDVMAQVQEVDDAVVVGSTKRGNDWVSSATIAAEVEQQKQATIITKAQAVTKLAKSYRKILRDHYGVGAETNQAVTEARVTLDMLDPADNTWKQKDITTIVKGFEVLTGITGAAETWSFPWAQIPE